MKLPRTAALAIALSLSALVLDASAQAAGALPAPPEAAAAPETLIGLDPAGALALLGPPSSLGVARGAEPWQDDAVFRYPWGLELYWFGDRIWQVGLGAGSPLGVRGLRPGDPLDKALSLLGPPAWSGEPGPDGLVPREWALAHDGWPLRLRALARGESGAVEALYAYRADF